MEITVRVVPNAKSPSLERIGEREYRARVDAPALEGRANMRLAELLAEHFGVRKSDILILRGSKGRTKLVRILSKG